MAERLRDDRGTSLVEVLMGSMVTLLILTAAYGVIVTATNTRIRTTTRVETLNRGRDGMEQVTRLLRAQTCNEAAPPVILASNDSLVFHVAALDGSGGDTIEVVRLAWTESPGRSLGDGGTTIGDITMTRYGPMTPGGALPARENFINGSADASAVIVAPRTIARDVSRTSPTTPIFRYLPLSEVNRVAVGEVSNGAASAVEQAVPFSMAVNDGFASVPHSNRARIAAIDVQFTARPRNGRITKSNSIDFYDRVTVRGATDTMTGGELC